MILGEMVQRAAGENRELTIAFRDKRGCCCDRSVAPAHKNSLRPAVECLFDALLEFLGPDRFHFEPGLRASLPGGLSVAGSRIQENLEHGFLYKKDADHSRPASFQLVIAKKQTTITPLQLQKPARAEPSGDSRSFSNARSRICLIRSRVTPISAPIFSRVIASDPCSRP